MAERRTADTRGPRTTRVDWVPGLGVVAAAVGAGAVLGYTAATGRPPVYLSLTVCAVIIASAARVWWRTHGPIELGLWRRSTPSTSLSTHSATAAATPLTPPPIDLSRDRRTDAQKYLM